MKEQVHGGDPRDDAFWDLDELLPHKKPAFTPVNTDTETVEISVEAEQARRIMASRPIVPDEKLPPADERHGARHTPADVRPIMSEPVMSYSVPESLLSEVSIWRWPARYHFFDRFYTDAQRYFERTAPKSDYLPFYAYVPQYHMMNADQLRYYFYWRSEVRQGRYPRTDYSYLFLYLYEIINLPERIPPQQGLAAMTSVWLAYRADFPRLDRYLGEWVADYCLCNRLPMPQKTLSPILGELFDKVSLKEFYIVLDGEGKTPFSPSLCDALSDHDWRASRYLNDETRQAFRDHYYRAILGALNAVWKEEKDFAALLGLTEVTQTRDAFSGAICTHNVKRRIDVRLLSVSRSYQFRSLLTLLCKFTENAIRAHFGIKSRLSCPGLDERLRGFVRRYFDTYLPPLSKIRKEQCAAERERIRAGEEPAPEYAHYYEADRAALSVEGAMKIEAASWEVTELLTAEEDGAPSSAPTPQPVSVSAPTPAAAPAEAAPQTAVPREAVPVSDDPYENFVNGLSPLEYEALKSIINGEKAVYTEHCARLLLLPDAMAELLNDRAVALTGDVAVEEDADGTFYHLSDYYANEITDAVIAREEREHAF